MIRFDILLETTDVNSTRYKHLMTAYDVATGILKKFELDDVLRGKILNTVLLHDVGYSDSVGTTGNHCIDGPVYLKDKYDGICFEKAIMFHGAAYEVSCGKEREYFDEKIQSLSKLDLLVLDFLDYCDWHSDGYGNRCTIDERAEDVVSRHGMTEEIKYYVGEFKCRGRRIERNILNIVLDIQRTYYS